MPETGKTDDRRRRGKVSGERGSRRAPDVQPPRHGEPLVHVEELGIGADVDLAAEDVRLADGTRLTDEVATEIVHEVRHRVGRPSLTGRPAVSPHISLRVSDELRDQLLDLADDAGLTLSQLARRILEEHVAAVRR